MKVHPFTQQNWLIVALIALALGLWFAAPFISVIALAALVAFLSHGIYSKFLRRMKSGVAAVLTMLFTTVVILVPTAIILTFTFIQLSQLAVSVAATFSGQGVVLPEFVQQLVQTANTIAAPFVGAEAALTTQGIVEFLRTTLPEVLRNVVSIAAGFVTNIPVAIILLILFLMLYFEFLVYGRKIVAGIIALSPFQPDITRMYLARIGLMANAMAKGQLLISFIISLLSAIILSVFLGLGEYFFLMTVAFTLLNLIPLGCGIVVIPIALFAMVTGSFIPGLIALVLYIIVSNLDAVIRPRIIPRSITLTPGLTSIAAFGGIVMFGLLGVVYGPIIMIIVVTSIQMYLDYYKQSGKKQPTRRTS